MARERARLAGSVPGFAAHAKRLEAERQKLLRLHAAGVTLTTLARIAGRSMGAVERILRGDWRA